MSAKTFGKLYQAERKVLSEHHRQQERSEEPLRLLEALGELANQVTELSDNPKDASLKPKSVVPQEQKKTEPTELLDLEVQITSAEAPAFTADELKSPPKSSHSTLGNTEDLNPTVSPGRGVPFVDYVPDDLAAICSSGGGIRSAIFNLGVLQGLCKLGLLPLFDYHSTVSGGGYLGGWWTTWRANNPHKLCPESDSNLVEHAAIRRLRERSRFLSPTGFALGAEIWSGLFLWSAGLVATLLMALSVV